VYKKNSSLVHCNWYSLNTQTVPGNVTGRIWVFSILNTQTLPDMYGEPVSFFSMCMGERREPGETWKVTGECSL
jgi:hypothetical protein